MIFYRNFHIFNNLLICKIFVGVHIFFLWAYMGVHCTLIENLYAHTNVRPWAYMGVHGRTWAYIVRPQKIVRIFFVGVHVRPCTPMGVQLCGRTNFLWAYNVRPCTPMGVLGVLGVICGRTGRTWAYKGVHGRNIAGASSQCNL